VRRRRATEKPVASESARVDREEFMRQIGRTTALGIILVAAALASESECGEAQAQVVGVNAVVKT
jgi:hypothetical protein